jgi:hypothetical protein
MSIWDRCKALLSALLVLAAAEICRIRFFLFKESGRYGQALPLTDNRGGVSHDLAPLTPMMPNAIPRCAKLQSFVYLKLQNKVIV